MTDYMGLVVRTHGLMEALRLVRFLGLSSVTNLQKSPKRLLQASRGSKGISSAARVRVRDCATLLQERHGCERLTFLTLTLPPSCLQPEVVRHWSEIVRKLRQWLVYRLDQAQLPSSVCAVTEIQEVRQRQAGRIPCLHLHAVFVGRARYGTWVLTPEDIDKYWSRLLQSYTKKQVDVSCSCQLKRVKKDVAGYLGKYMSKGMKSFEGVDCSLLPSSWVMITRDLLNERRQRTVRCEGEVATALWGMLLNRPELFRFGRYIEIEARDGQPIVLGWYGELVSRNAYHELCREIHEFRAAVRN